MYMFVDTLIHGFQTVSNITKVNKYIFAMFNSWIALPTKFTKCPTTKKWFYSICFLSGGSYTETWREPKVIQIAPKPGSGTQHQQPQVVRVYAGGAQSTSSAGTNQPPGAPRQTTLLNHVQQVPPHILQQMYAGTCWQLVNSAMNVSFL